nr:MAG TPA: minor capsid protein 2 [Caudoviricetes sp.]
MQISLKDWENYINKLSRISDAASEKMQLFLSQKGTDDFNQIIDYAKALESKYGTASAELACQMYDEIAKASGVIVPPAEMADEATIAEVARSINANRTSPSNMVRAVSRLVKQREADTILHNAKRDKAEFAWVSHGDTCAFCLAIAAKGWQVASGETIKGDHAEHIHAKCNCEFSVRFDKNTDIEGYDPDKLSEEYENAEGKNSQEKINSLRRKMYAKGKEPVVKIPANPDMLIEEHDAPKLIKKINANDSKQVDKELRKFTRDYYNAPIENALVICDNGDIYHCYGVEASVYPDYDLGDKIKNSTIIHNHPEHLTAYTFSDDDVRLFIKYELKELYGVDDKYIYKLSSIDLTVDKLPDEWWHGTTFRHSQIITSASKNSFGYRRINNDFGRRKDKI